MLSITILDQLCTSVIDHVHTSQIKNRSLLPHLPKATLALTDDNIVVISSTVHAANRPRIVAPSLHKSSIMPAVGKTDHPQTTVTPEKATPATPFKAILGHEFYGPVVIQRCRNTCHESQLQSIHLVIVDFGDAPGTGRFNRL